MREYPSFEAARLDFEAYARLDPRLRPLWTLCRRATAPQPANDADEDPFDRDVFDHDPIASGSPSDGWCSEDYFDQIVKRQLVALVGSHRVEGPPELQTREAWEAVYSALLYYALNRQCVCCREQPKRVRIGGR